MSDEKRRGWESNPPEVYTGIGDGPASAYSKLGKQSEQIPREQIVKDLVDLLRAMPLSDAQVEELYRTISERVRHKVCSRCKKLRPVIDGAWEIHPSLDITKPKTFICKDCK